MAGTPTFATQPSFMGLTRARAAATIWIAGIPLDIGVTNRPGARFGPAAIRQASRMLVDGEHPVSWLDPLKMPVADAGDFEIALGDLEKSLAMIASQAEAAPHLVALGGEHGITLPLLRALKKRRGRPAGLVHFDAHVDTWPESFGQVHGHGSPFFHAIEEDLIDPARTVQIGIRSPMQRSVWDWTTSKGVTILSAQDVHGQGVAAISAQIRAVIGDHACYLTFDIDALDPSCAPGTGTPEIGGLFSWQAQSILRSLAGLKWIGMDVVEVAPAYDVSEITSLAAATVVWEYLSLLSVAPA